jgi:hypothetical protein
MHASRDPSGQGLLFEDGGTGDMDWRGPQDREDGTGSKRVRNLVRLRGGSCHRSRSTALQTLLRHLVEELLRFFFTHRRYL